jgi:hypothetical protein
MWPAFRSHSVEVRIDDETWRALEAKAAQRGEPVDQVIAYAIELFMQGEGFTPQWAQAPLGLAPTGDPGCDDTA